MICSARRSAFETKSAGPLRETCRFSTSLKSRVRDLPALMAALTITLRRAERAISDLLASSCGGCALGPCGWDQCRGRKAPPQNKCVAGLLPQNGARFKGLGPHHLVPHALVHRL